MGKDVRDEKSKADMIRDGDTALGIELGSTYIKAVLTGADHKPLVSGGYKWENRLENGYWTYSLDLVWEGIRDCFRQIKEKVRAEYDIVLTKIGVMGISAMMHGFLPFDKEGELLTPFRTWRNTCTGKAAAELTQAFSFNIPQRWSIAHLYQAMLNREEYVVRIDHMTTLAGYVHWKLTGKKVLGIGDASGMFPVNGKGYDSEMLEKFHELERKAGYSLNLSEILPRVLLAGEDAGALTEEGAMLLDPEGDLSPSIPLCPPEGDAGTGMVATNSVLPRTGNVSAGTSIFSMVVLEKPLSGVHTEIDIVATPSGHQTAMVHCNNCTSDINGWAELFCDVAKKFGSEISYGAMLDLIFKSALAGEPDCGGIASCNYYSGEPVTGLEKGRPMLTRLPDARFNFNNLSRSLVFSAIASLKIGMDILTEKEGVRIETLTGHGGFFKSEAGIRLMSAALDVPVSVLPKAEVGGPWGMALLASYRLNRSENETLSDYLENRVFSGMEKTKALPDKGDSEGFNEYMKRYAAVLEGEKKLAERFI